MWPTADDLRSWLRSEQVTETSPEMLALSFDAASELIRDRIDSVLLTAKAEKAGVIVDDTDPLFDQVTLDAYCPSYVRQAILIRAASIYVRRDSANGTISFGEFATSVRSLDPDVESLLAPVTALYVA